MAVPMPLNPSLCELRRGAYAYPPARIRRNAAPSSPLLPASPYDIKNPEALGWPTKSARFSSWGHDAYHRRLLHSSSAQDQFDGVLSIVYWGNYAGSTGDPAAYARARARWMVLGKKNCPADSPTSVSRAVIRARTCLTSGPSRLQDAIQALDEISFIGLSFASKILAFMDPHHCAVLDSVLLDAFRKSRDPALAAIRSNPIGFENWCLRCERTAAALNTVSSTWVDWNGRRYKWRAVDVERAAFAQATLNFDPAYLLV